MRTRTQGTRERTERDRRECVSEQQQQQRANARERATRSRLVVVEARRSTRVPSWR